MKYISLKKLYYKDNQNHQQTYRQRFNAPFTEHINIPIRQYNRNKVYPAFFCLTKEIAKLQENILSANNKLLQIVDVTPEIVLKQLALLCIIDEVQSSNEIEGVHSTRRELMDAMSSLKKGTRYVSTIYKYHLLTNQKEIPFATCHDLRQFYDEFAHDEVITENAANRLDGNIFRAGSVDMEAPTGKSIHRGVYPESKIIAYMETLLGIFNDKDLPVLISTALCHYLFAYIHPFYDGNGRTARFLTSYQLTQVLHYTVALRLSITIKKNRKDYYDLFSLTDDENNCGDLTPFVTGFLHITHRAVNDTIALLQRKLAQYKKNLAILEQISEDALSQNIYKLLFQASLLYGQGITMQELSKLLGKSTNTIKSRLQAMPNEHIIIIQRNRKKFYKLNLLLLKKYTYREN